MRNLKRWMICGLAAMMLMTGCSKKEKEPETQATEATEATEATDADMDKGSVTKLGTYIGVEVTKPSTDVTDAELDQRIQDLLLRNPERIAVTDRPAELGDIVNIDYVGLLDGEPFTGGTSEGSDLKLGSGSFIAGFEEGLVGANVGDELSLNLTFPESYHSAEMAGKEVVFDVTVNSIELETPAVLDNNFVQRMSDFSTVDEFKADTLADMEAEKETAAAQQLENDAVTAAIANSEYEINEETVDKLCQEEMELSKTMYPQSYGIEFADYLTMMGQTEEDFLNSMKDSVRESFKWEILVDAIIEKEGITIGDEQMEQLAAKFGATVEQLTTQYGEETVQGAAKINAVITLIVDNAVVK